MQSAAVRGRAGILVNPELDGTEMLRGHLLADVLDGGDGLVGAVVDRLATGVDAGQIAGVRDGLCPREEIAGLVGREAAALLLIEKDDGLGGEVFAPRCGYCCCRVFLP